MLDSWYLEWKKEEEIGLSELDYKVAEEAILVRLPKPDPEKRRFTLWPRFAIAASVIVLLSTGLYLYVSSTSGLDPKNDLPAGTRGATLTLSNGRKILLSAAVKGELANEGGVRITKTAIGNLVYQVVSTDQNKEANYNILSTANGQMYQIILPDQSSVWLNAASSLKYPSSFRSMKSRTVELIGEAYFEIKKDKAHPFIVKTDKQKVEVLGTHFNINSYSDEAKTTTTLFEGSVRVLYFPSLRGGTPTSLRGGTPKQSTPQSEIASQARNGVEQTRNEGEAVVLKPGEQAVLALDNAIEVKTANTEEALAWKNGYFRFNDENLRSIMRKIARWYNIGVTYQDYTGNEGFTGTISRSKSINEVLNMLEKTKGTHFKIEGRRVTVME